MFTKEVLQGILRHVLTALGGGIVTTGVITQGEAEMIVGGLVTLFGVIWSVMSKKAK